MHRSIRWLIRLALIATAVMHTSALAEGARRGLALRLPFIEKIQPAWKRARFQCTVSAAASLPNPLNASLDCRRDKLGFSVGGGLFSSDIQIASQDARARLSGNNLELRLRWYPWGGRFFVGSALGYQNLELKAEKNVDVDYVLWSETVTASLDFKTHRPYVMPHLGWSWTFAKRAVVGLELGWLVPIAPKTHVNVDADGEGLSGLGVDFVKLFGVTDMAEGELAKLGDAGLPYVALRVGWAF